MMYIVGAFVLALLVTLALASFLTPAGWWRRPNVKALAVLVAGTWGIGSLLLGLVPERAEAKVAVVTSVPATMNYTVFEDLNLRSAAGVHAHRLALVPAGSIVTTTGLRDGDWWQVRTLVNDRLVDGWVSSLWLRRAEESQHRQRHP